MDLCIDIGNTRTKAFVFDRGHLAETFVFDSSRRSSFQDWIKDAPVYERGLLCSVKRRDPDLVDTVRQHAVFFLELDDHTPLPFVNMYQSKSTLGKDRMALIAGAQGLFPGRDVLVVDAGTAITFDVISREGKYLGGNIAPGSGLRFQSLHSYTDCLPLRMASDAWPLLGNTTNTAIEAGVMQGICYEVEGYITSLSLSFGKNFVVVLTGGDARYFEKKMKYPVFMKPDLLAEGLYRILEFNH